MKGVRWREETRGGKGVGEDESQVNPHLRACVTFTEAPAHGGGERASVSLQMCPRRSN